LKVPETALRRLEEQKDELGIVGDGIVFQTELAVLDIAKY
jgi:hypothetical protein